jgi:hypothetical protein
MQLTKAISFEGLHHWIQLDVAFYSFLKNLQQLPIFCLKDEIESDCQFVDISLSGLIDRDFELQSVGLTKEPGGFADADFWFIVEE